MSKTEWGKTYEAVRRFLYEYMEAHDGMSPTYDEIMEGVGLRSKSGIAWHLHNLEDQGVIELRGKGTKSRHIHIVGAVYTLPVWDGKVGS